MTGDRVVREIEYGDRRMVAGITVQVQQLIWSHGGVSYDVFHVGTGENLTVDGSFGYVPTDEQIRDLLVMFVGFWCCQGCGKTYKASDADQIKDHCMNCDLHAFQYLLWRETR